MFADINNLICQWRNRKLCMTISIYIHILGKQIIFSLEFSYYLGWNCILLNAKNLHKLSLKHITFCVLDCIPTDLNTVVIWLMNFENLLKL